MTQLGTSNDTSEKQSESLLWAKDSSQLLGDYSKHLSNERIVLELAQIATDPKIQPIEEALAALQESRTALELLEKEDPKEAKSALERSIGMLDRINSNHSGVSLVPVSFNMGISDMYADDATLKRFTNEVKDLLAKGRFQRARILLRDFASEIDIITESLPIANYSDLIKTAALLLEQGNIQGAKTQLLHALDTLVKAEWPIPLPVVRAQALLEEVSRQVNENRIDKEQVLRLLEDADQQLTFSENLGYGVHLKDFEELHNLIRDVKKAISQDPDFKEVLSKLKSNLQFLREENSKSHQLEKDLERIRRK